jgi:hypothetical protein
MPWSTSQRRRSLPRDWPKLRAQVKARAAGRCQAATHEPDCDGTGRECDHIDDRDDHALSNLQWLSTPCHKAKTRRESEQARGVGASRFRDRESHPGLI